MNNFGEKKQEILNYIMKAYEKCAEGNTGVPCPLCGTSLYVTKYGEYNQSGIIYCKTHDCLQITFRGL